MNLAAGTGNATRLVFCRENVDPDVVSRMLNLAPSESVKVGEPAAQVNGVRCISPLGTWTFNLPSAHADQTVEEQIGVWVELLGPKSLALKELRGRGYCPYLDCKAEAGSLSVCIEPELLASLGKLNVPRSIGLHEQPCA